MKKIALIFLTLSFATASFADIQSPPGGKDNRMRKLSRAVANIVYGINEVPYTWARTNGSEGPDVSASDGLLNGAKRSIVRLGFGVYEFVTFPFPTYKGSYRAPGKKIWWDLNHGYTEFPPEIGFRSEADYTRTQGW